MNRDFQKYHKALTVALDRIMQTQEEAVDRAADFMAASIRRDELIHVFGTGGHSSMGAEEMFWRAGCLAPVNPILEPALLPGMGARHSNWIERTEGIAPSILNAYGVKKGETIILVNAYGINAVTIDAALECKRRGTASIGVTSTSFASFVPKGHPSRHSSGKSLHELVDVFIDNQMPLGDACVEVEGCPQKLAPTSTILNSFCLHLLVIRTVEKLVEAGIEPPIWTSLNLPGGDEKNRKWHEKYDSRVKHLR